MPRRFLVAIIALVFLLGVVLGVWGAFATSDSATPASVEQVHRIVEAQARTSARNDCRAMIQAARRDVLDTLNFRLDVDRTVHDQILGKGLLSRVAGTTSDGQPDPALLAAYEANNTDLTVDILLTVSLIPKLPGVDAITDHGGTMPVLGLDRSVTYQHFDPCPKVK